MGKKLTCNSFCRHAKFVSVGRSIASGFDRNGILLLVREHCTRNEVCAVDSCQEGLGQVLRNAVDRVLVRRLILAFTPRLRDVYTIQQCNISSV
eukprot:2756416-Amphidinium_carterae.2